MRAAARAGRAARWRTPGRGAGARGEKEVSGPGPAAGAAGEKWGRGGGGGSGGAPVKIRV